jgi:gluconate 2-dehydrogenase gamma chain
MNRRDFLRGTSLAALTCSLPTRGAQPEPGVQGRVLAGHQWRTLAVVQDHFFPSEPGAPGSGDIRATAYLDGVLGDPDLDPETRTFVLSGIGWLDDLAQEGHGRPFADLDPAPREDLLRRIGESGAGDRWLSVLIGYTIEALLGDPLYGGNPGGIGWVWLDHDPGRPRPTPSTIYGRLGKA